MNGKILLTCCDNWCGEGRVYVEIPPEEEVLSLETALQSLQDHAWEHVDAIYPYWLGKRSLSKKPLLEEFWNQFPWSVRSLLSDLFFCLTHLICLGGARSIVG